MVSPAFDTEKLTRLAAIPARIAHATEKVADEQLHTAPDEGAWSAGEIFAHIRASSDILSNQIYMLLTRDAVAIADLDERRWAEVTRYTFTDLHQSLAVYTLRRAELIHALQYCSPDDWERVAFHETRGPRSLREIVTWLLEHEEEHCAQLEASLQK